MSAPQFSLNGNQRYLDPLDVHADTGIANVQASMGHHFLDFNWVCHQLKGRNLAAAPRMEAGQDIDYFKILLFCYLALDSQGTVEVFATLDGQMDATRL